MKGNGRYIIKGTIATALGHGLKTPVFIIGTGRCGTTLLVQVLKSHERLSGTTGKAGGLRRLAPQKDLIAAGQKHDRPVVATCLLEDSPNCIVPELSNSGSPPAEPGGCLVALRFSGRGE